MRHQAYTREAGVWKPTATASISSQLILNSEASAYNAALCNERLGFYVDAARWYEEVLRRNPGRTDRQDLLSRIAALRR
ncbi:MAG TPA: hypothetical protein VIX37_07680 [Candidatus Sulfotelmatobacter sp.]